MRYALISLPTRARCSWLFSSRIVAEAIKAWSRGPRPLGASNDWYFQDHVYTKLGYNLVGNTAVLPPKPNPFLLGKPPWAR